MATAQETRDKAQMATAVSMKIRDTAKLRKEDPLQVQSRFAVERFLRRLSTSDFADKAVLKGGVLMVALTGDHTRPTQDLNMYMNNGMDELAVRNFVANVCSMAPGEEDGLVFDTSKLSIEESRDRNFSEPGYLVRFDAVLMTQPRPTPIRMKLDLAWGSVPSIRHVEIPPAIKGFPPVQVRSYPWEFAVAEKLHAIIRHGSINTRYKDSYDLVVFARSEPFDGESLREAIVEVFKEWKEVNDEGKISLTPDPIGLSDEWAADNERGWTRFRAGKSLKMDIPTLGGAVKEIREFLRPLLVSTVQDLPFRSNWTPGQGWSEKNTPSAAPHSVRMAPSP